MKRNSKERKRRKVSVRAWSHEEARRALPYITSVMGSLREHWLEAQSHDRTVRHLAAMPGRPDRNRIIYQADEGRLGDEALDRLQAAEEELVAIDVYCTNPVRGEGVIPFVHDKQLAWFIYDLFDPTDLRFWRYHNDPADTRRPVAEVLEVPRVA